MQSVQRVVPRRPDECSMCLRKGVRNQYISQSSPMSYFTIFRDHCDFVWEFVRTLHHCCSDRTGTAVISLNTCMGRTRPHVAKYSTTIHSLRWIIIICSRLRSEPPIFRSAICKFWSRTKDPTCNMPGSAASTSIGSYGFQSQTVHNRILQYPHGTIMC